MSIPHGKDRPPELKTDWPVNEEEESVDMQIYI